MHSHRTQDRARYYSYQQNEELFTERDLIRQFDTKETVMQLNGVHIEAYPSHHLDAMRGIPNVSFILLDEADFFPPGQQQDARDVSREVYRQE